MQIGLEIDLTSNVAKSLQICIKHLFFNDFWIICQGPFFEWLWRCFLPLVCTSDVLKSRFYYSKTIIFKDLHAFSKLSFLSTCLSIFLDLVSNFHVFSHTFWIYFCSSMFDVILMQKRCPKSTKNDPKIVSSSIKELNSIQAPQHFDFYLIFFVFYTSQISKIA